jgi:hypothetical protein
MAQLGGDANGSSVDQPAPSTKTRAFFVEVDAQGNRRVIGVYEDGVAVYDANKEERFIPRKAGQTENLLDKLTVGGKEPVGGRIKIDGRWYTLDRANAHEIEEQTKYVYSRARAT